jgi:hypothetical protein
MSGLEHDEAVVMVDGETRVVRMRDEGWTVFWRVATLLDFDVRVEVGEDDVLARLRWADVCGLLPDGNTPESLTMLVVACAQILARGLAVA